MYINIPFKHIIRHYRDYMLNNGIESTLRQEILRITRLIITQKYFHFQDKTYRQKKGLAMGAPQFLHPFRDSQYMENIKCPISSAD
jgi:hypothetical protein